MKIKDDKAKLERLKRLDESSRQRQKRHIEKAIKQGKKQISCRVSGEVYNEICRQRDASRETEKTLSIAGVIERAFTNVSSLVNINVARNVNINGEKNPEKSNELGIFGNEQPPESDGVQPKQLPYYHGRDISPEERDNIVFQIYKILPDRGQNPARVEALNEAGLLTAKGGQWTTQILTSHLTNAKRRKEKKRLEKMRYNAVPGTEGE